MKILSCQVSNFASYKQLDFDFQNQGLTLISGPTGSGKSTLCDVVPWVLFGRTAKGGAVDEVIPLGSNEQAEGRLTVELSNGEYLTVVRLRTKKSQDLYYEDERAERNRGKDISDTQKQINNLLGFDYDLYMSASYFHEFSTTASFFTATAKVRRQITEQLVDLTLAKKLIDRSSEYKKEVKAELVKLQNELGSSDAILKSVINNIKSDQVLELNWTSKYDARLVELKIKRDDYKNYHTKQLDKSLKEHKKRQEELETELLELEKSIKPESDLNFYKAALAEEKRLFDLVKDAKCPACGNSKNNSDKKVMLIKREYELDQAERNNERFLHAIQLKAKELKRHSDSQARLEEAHSTKDNPYIKQLEDLEKEENPYTVIVQKRIKERKKLQSELRVIRSSISEFQQELSDLELLLEVTDIFRAALVKNTVVELETNTNKILSDYFDAEIQVKFELSDMDKLEITITKNDNECVYTQLSKGQRQLLKLAFAVSVMGCISNHHGLDFNAIFLDEALDGLDDVLKVKAYDLLQYLVTKHESVFVVEHNEALKTLFPKRYEVTLSNEGSEIGEA